VFVDYFVRFLYYIQRYIDVCCYCRYMRTCRRVCATSCDIFTTRQRRELWTRLR